MTASEVNQFMFYFLILFVVLFSFGIYFEEKGKMKKRRGDEELYRLMTTEPGES